ncbi:MAG: hypothetical protein IBJ11_09700 [Phycisphaerales bacterium]|nr:hypothetical protein [Phycisphaerales bacterium]
MSTFRRLGVAMMVCAAVSPAIGQQMVLGPPDRMIITRFMSSSSMLLRDLNNDGAISDVDVSMMVLDQLVAMYGPSLDVGDVDGNGVVNGEDVVAAIATMIRGCFGKTAAAFGPVGGQDVAATATFVIAGSLRGDLNFDGASDVEDVVVTVEAVGQTVAIASSFDETARELFTYIGAIRSLGRAHFMATGPVSNTHSTPVSGLWPADHPRWWRANHMVAISREYDDGGKKPVWHEPATSSRWQSPSPHDQGLSEQWPANHAADVSASWLKPPVHNVVRTEQRPADGETHEAALSSKWPLSHVRSASNTWGPDHEVQISRTWWPGHDMYDSRARVWPPVHAAYGSAAWDRYLHNRALSQAAWPPNHEPRLSSTWGLPHLTGTSSFYPSNHFGYASGSWEGPRPMWPAGHFREISRTWNEVPREWPLFPADHSWFTTFSQVPNIIPRHPF